MSDNPASRIHGDDLVIKARSDRRPIALERTPKDNPYRITTLCWAAAGKAVREFVGDMTVTEAASRLGIVLAHQGAIAIRAIGNGLRRSVRWNVVIGRTAVEFQGLEQFALNLFKSMLTSPKWVD